jgi:branched-chain amino acid transport system ATP-binding protein
VLRINDLSFSYGKIEVLRKVTLEAKRGQITAILGPNGAGKSTLVNNIAGLLTPSGGEITLQEENITRLAPHERVKRGISVVPERRRLFEHLSVLENLKAGAFLQRKQLKDNLEYVYTLFPLLKDRSRALVSSLSGGQQQVVALARGLMAHPLVLILDEPLFGIQPSIVLELIADLKRIQQAGTTILLVEQNFYMVAKIMHWAYIMEHGTMTLSGTAEEISENPEVKRAYLGL